jgi:O-phospho-L-seryl-tRNASec:L-selenocysteinyl-tRNA synthase
MCFINNLLYIKLFLKKKGFSPRSPDNIIEISKLCKKYNIGHVIDNAYGLQCPKIMKDISISLNVGLF